jgi:hypothetical protein
VISAVDDGDFGVLAGVTERQIGPVDAIATRVHREARRGGDAVREAAVRVLPTLLARKEAETNSGTLLRHSYVPQATAGEMLRPVAGPGGEDEEGMLLRPN